MFLDFKIYSGFLESGLGIRSSVFRANRLFFVIERAIHLWKRANRSCRSLKRATEQRAHSRLFLKATRVNRSRSLFLKSDESESLKVAFFERATRVNRSLSIFFKDRRERKCEFPTLILMKGSILPSLKAKLLF